MAYTAFHLTEISIDELRALWQDNEVIDLTVMSRSITADRPSVVVLTGPVRETLAYFASHFTVKNSFSAQSHFDEIYAAIMGLACSRRETVYFFTGN